MKLGKAIEILTLQSKSPTTSENIDHNLALILGIEALWRISNIHHLSFEEQCAPLPGETPAGDSP